ncbi:Uncharacterised protein [Mycobacterium tuberculosis]|uniref:Uncharacterized protein n=1 Tax=Mycobacterium tuberculosis TaxID=1773 RepID=A0A655A9Q5_MYCTX|nr:Uncharacterised protein [Mycobacterium tuberculosis]CFS30680.1 Uncharacterised protein [Mycobacterium tuberculosis]CKR58157.1 Uncharacterised protein [Mycobacterium tuberculosis]CKS65063.1 Uncharacterised protein [Mycobacterium tuberculosis]CKT27188.1 Uncharacterised protein [Mycobacterium tuberculosis]
MPDSARITSAIRLAVVIAGRPTATPEFITPKLAASSLTSRKGWTVYPLVVIPNWSMSGPRVSHLS